jgi:hypothetical protein
VHFVQFRRRQAHDQQGSTCSSNRDKSQHSDERGMDGSIFKSEQLHDHAANRLDDDAAE